MKRAPNGARCYCTAYESCEECERYAEAIAEELEAEETRAIHAACARLGGACSRCAKCRDFFRLGTLSSTGHCADCADSIAALEIARERAKAGRMREALNLEEEDIPF